MIDVIRAGMLSSVQDLGRAGYRHLGVSSGGALDALSLEIGNRIVGNKPDAAGIELTLGPTTLRFTRATRVAITGTDFAATLDDKPVYSWWSLPVQAGQELTLRGAKMLATSGIMANEVFVSCIQPLGPGDEKYAVSLALPLNTRGIKLLSRKSYEGAAPSIYDNPLASRFDENDAVIYFDDVKVPWDRIFVVRDTAMMQKQFHATPAHVLQNYQCQVRLMVKMRFLMGIAHRIAEINGTIGLPPVRDALGQLAAEAGLVEGMVRGMEAKGCVRNGYYVPDTHLLYAAQVLTQQLYSKVITSMRDLAGGGLIMLPSSAEDFAHPDIARIIDKTQQSPNASAEQRVKFFKLAWDAIGSEFASRHTQYEMFYAGAQFVTASHSFRTYDWDGAAGLLDGLLSGYDIDIASPAVAAQ